MVPDTWNGDLTLLWSELACAWGVPDREAALLQWFCRRTPGEWARIDAFGRGYGRVDGPWLTPPARAAREARGTLAEGWRSFAADGHTRERAVLALAHSPEDAAHGFLLVRCDDWVGAVRSKAQAAIAARIADGRMDLLTWMPLVLARDARTRSGGLAHACAASAAGHVVEHLLTHPDRPTRSWARTTLLARDPDASTLERLLGQVHDPGVTRAFATRLADRADDATLQRLLVDRRVVVRRAAWDRVVDGRLPDLDLRAGLLDASASLRGLAAGVARARGLDAGEVYRTTPGHSPALRRRILYGLAAWGSTDAVPAARAALDDPDPYVRAAAIDVLAHRLDRPDDLLRDLLRSRRGAELRAVVRAMLARRIRVDDDDLAGLRRGDAHQRLAAWRLRSARGRWDRLLADLLALGDDDADLAQIAAADLGNWLAYVMPDAGTIPPALRPALAAALAAAQRRGHPIDLVAWVLRK